MHQQIRTIGDTRITITGTLRHQFGICTLYLTYDFDNRSTIFANITNPTIRRTKTDDYFFFAADNMSNNTTIYFDELTFA